MFRYRSVAAAAVTLAASSYLVYRIFLSSPSIETLRKEKVSKRKTLVQPKEKYASLKIDTRFVNPFEEWTEIPFYKTVFFWMKRYKGNGIPSCEKELEKVLPVMKPDLSRKSNDNVTFTWFGQSTCLMTIDGLTILSDPVFSRCSINDYVGPKRIRPLPCSLEEFMHDIDIVVVSHDHFDHLDENVVRKLGNSVTWYIPLGLKNWFLKRNVDNVIELDWWQEITHEIRPDIKIACVPAMHWSGSRTPFEKNNTLWCSYVIQSKKHKIFFCGDTGYSPELFRTIGELYAPFTLAAIPIGSFMPTYLMQHLHMGPEDAIKAHIDLGYPRLSVGIHWATFMMSDEYYLDPKLILDKVWEEHYCSSKSNDNEIYAVDEDMQSVSSSSSSTLVSIQQDAKRVAMAQSKFITTAFGQTVALD